MLPDNQRIAEESQRGNKTCRDKWKWKQRSKPGHSKTLLRGMFVVIQSYWETRNISNKQLNCLKQLQKEQTKPKVSRRKEIIKMSQNKWNKDKRK